MDVGRIECHEDRIKVESAHGFKQNGRVMMPGEAKESNAAVLSGLHQRLKCARHVQRSS